MTQAKKSVKANLLKVVKLHSNELYCDPSEKLTSNLFY